MLSASLSEVTSAPDSPSGMLLRKQAGRAVGTRQVERHAEALGRETAEDEREIVEPEQAGAATLCPELDGTGSPVRRE